MIDIPFNKPFLTGKETQYINEAVVSGTLSGNGIFTNKCHNFFENKYGFKKTLLTTSCTDALEMCAMLLDVKEGDEIIVPSYTFVSTALAFVRQGAKIVFADSRSDHPNIDVDKIEDLITDKTKAIVVVHYAGISVDMDMVMSLSEKYNISIVEDAAQAIDSTYKGKTLGGIGHLGVYSFHETKNIISGEGGLLIINDDKFIDRAEVLWEKGTNRASFYRGEINKYSWVDIGSSFLPSEIVAAFLFSQLENIDNIQYRRKSIWNQYYKGLTDISDKVQLPVVPSYSTTNGHMFYLVTKSSKDRDDLISYLKKNKVHSVFHYLSLHMSDYYLKNNKEEYLPMSDLYTDCLVRLPLYYELNDIDVDRIIKLVKEFFNG